MSRMKARTRPGRTPRASIVRAMGAVVFAGLFAVACDDVTGPEQLETLTLTPATSTVEPTSTVQLTAVGTRAGTPVTRLVGETYEVTSGGGTVSADGLFTAPTTPGTSTIMVTCANLTATATVTVVAGPLATITVTPNPVTLPIGGTQQFTAVGRDAFNNVVQISPVWTATNPPGTINAGTGLFTAGMTLGTFENSVRATVGSIFGTATVTVVAGPLATIEVTPDPVTLAIGAQQQFTAVGRDAGGNVVSIPNLVWSTANPPGSINASTGLFTAGNTTGTFANSVRATSGTIFDEATVTVIAGPLATIEVSPDPVTLAAGANQQFTAVGRDGGGNVVPIPNLQWTTTNPPGSINVNTGLFTAGVTTGTFANSVRATSGTIFDDATVTVTAPVVPAVGYRMIARVAWTCTDGNIDGSVATNQTAGEVPPGSASFTNCPITGTTDIGSPAAKQAYQDFLVAYDDLEAIACGTTLTGTLAGVTLAPGVYCFDAGATLTGVLTLDGTATDTWLIKVGATVLGALSGTDFDVVMAGGASPCNVSWWVNAASTMVTSNFKGHILAGAGISFTGDTYYGNAWSKEDVTVTGTAITPCGAP
jgi:hypothetical protein